ncbi:MAG: glycosyltransferase family 4 protein [Massilia sp.]
MNDTPATISLAPDAAATARPGAPRVLMLGTDLAGRGGVAAIVSVLRDDGLFVRESVRYLPTHADGPRLRKARTAAAAFWRTAAICLRQRPALVHAHSASHASFSRKSLLLLIARVAGCRTVFHLHGGGFRRFARDESGPLKRRWIRHTLERSSAVVALSDSWAAFLREFAPRARVLVVPNAVPIPATPAIAEIPQRLLFLGRVEAAKGVFDLLAAVAPLLADFADLRLVVGGDGALAELRRQGDALGLGKRLILPGWLGADDKAAELARAAVFCLPSHAEGLPMAMLEAMAAAKVVVVTQVGAVPEVVSDGVNGLLVPPADVAALSAALRRALTDAALRASLGQAARATIEARFGTEVVAARLAALYAELAGPP